MRAFEKKLLVLRQQLIGARYFNALAAMSFAMQHHTGTRKDGVTPEFQHQVEIALYALTLPDLTHREEVITTIFLHDVREDYHITDGEIRNLFPRDAQFADRVSRSVELITKEWRGEKKPTQYYFDAMACDEIASIAKGCDRIHNYQSMVGVFSTAKQEEYLKEGDDYFLPMLKAARRNFPHQTNAYENIKFVMTSQMQLIRAALDAAKSE
jgi:(p)ppGpp synthase/HD superfamily hydrolase